MKKENLSDFKAGDIILYEGKEGLEVVKDHAGTAIVKSINGIYVNAKGLTGYYEKDHNLSFDLEYFDLFLEEDVIKEVK